MSPESPSSDSLHRGLKSRHLQLLALGGIIGSGYFLGTTYVLQQTGPAAFISYLLGGIIVLCVMYCLGELAVAIPISGSFVKYAEDLISPAWACGVGWSYWITWITYVPSEMIAGGIVMEHFFPLLTAPQWSVIFGLFITCVNLLHVRFFGEVEFWLALTKVLAIVLFVGLGVLILCGYSPQPWRGWAFLETEGGFFPFGALSVLLTMVIILVNFQGAEIIGLAAGESEDPVANIPRAVRTVGWRIMLLYVVPVFLLVSIFPWTALKLDESPFSTALSYYGFSWASAIFTIVVLFSAVSCSISGLYGCTRVIHSLAKSGMAPQILGRLNRHNVPQNALLTSTVACWIGVLFFVLDPKQEFYSILLSLSGFSGAISWISICWSQYNFRKRLIAQNVSVDTLKFKTPWFPYLTLGAIFLQIACLIVVVLHPKLQIAFFIGAPLLLIPILWYAIVHRKKNA